MHNAIKNGYEEYYVPFMANTDSLIGTGQLPKFEDDLFKTTENLCNISCVKLWTDIRNDRNSIAVNNMNRNVKSYRIKYYKVCILLFTLWSSWQL